MPGAGLGAGRLLGDQQTACGDVILKRRILWRIDDIDPARDDPRRSAADRAGMRRGVDPARETGNDKPSRLAEIMRKEPREADRRSARIARADDGDSAPIEQPAISPDDQQGRRGLDLIEQDRIIRRAAKQACGAQPLDTRQFAFGAGRVRYGRPRAAATSGQIGEGLQRCSAAAEAADQVLIGDRADAGRADQPQARYLFGRFQLSARRPWARSRRAGERCCRDASRRRTAPE